MHRTRRAILVVFVASALAADAMAASTPTQRPQIVETARKLAGRLVGSLRQNVSAIRFHPYLRGQQRSVVAARPQPISRQITLHRTELSPFQFRLPPPAL